MSEGRGATQRSSARSAPAPDGPSGERGASTPARLAAVLAVLAAFAVAVLLLFGGDGGHKYTLLFETGGQLVPGNQVLVAGQPVGTIDSIDLTDDNQAAISVTMEDPLREGTSAVIRSTSLSGVANRYISLTPGPNNSAELDDEETIGGEDTTAPVDLDQIFNVFRSKERRALQKFIDGNATAYAGKSRLANRAYKFLNPALSTSEQLFTELSSDSVALERFLVAGSKTFSALAERRDDLTSLVSNTNATLRAIASRNNDLDRSLAALPDTLRQGNTTFVNLRATLDDLDPLVAASKPATRDLAPFLRRLRLVATDGVPVFDDLAQVVSAPGAHDDLADTLSDLPSLRDEGRTALPAAIRAMNDSQDNVALLRPYTPDLFAFLSKFAESTAYYEGKRALRAGPAGGLQRLQLQRQRRGVRHASTRSTRAPTSSSTTCSRSTRRSAARAPAPRRPLTAPTRSSTWGTSASATATPTTSPRAHEEDRDHPRAPGRSRRARRHERHRRGRGRRRRLPGSRLLRQRRLPGQRRGRPDRGRDRRQRRGGRRLPARRGGDRGRLRGPGQGGRGAADQRRGVPGLPRRRLVPDPPAIAARREVRRMRTDPAPGSGQRAAGGARGHSRRRHR